MPDAAKVTTGCIMSLRVAGENNCQIQFSNYGIILSNMRRTHCYMYMIQHVNWTTVSTVTYKTVGRCLMLLEQDVDSRQDGQ